MLKFARILLSRWMPKEIRVSQQATLMVEAQMLVVFHQFLLNLPGTKDKNCFLSGLGDGRAKCVCTWWRYLAGAT